MIIKFTYNKRRKDKHKKSNFNPKLSGFWQKQYYEMFKNW